MLLTAAANPAGPEVTRTEQMNTVNGYHPSAKSRSTKDTTSPKQ